MARSTPYCHNNKQYNTKNPFMILPDDKENLKISSRTGDNIQFNDSDLGLANWVFEHEKSAGYGTDTLASSKWYYLPLKAHKSKLGVLAVAPYKSDITNEQKRLLEAYTRIVSIALANYLK